MRAKFWLVVCWATYPLFRLNILGWPYGKATGRYARAMLDAVRAGKPNRRWQLPHMERPPWPRA